MRPKAATVALLAALLLAVLPPASRALHAAPGACVPTLRVLARTGGPVDNLAVGVRGDTLALVGTRRAFARYLPHDDAVLVVPGGRSARAMTLAVPHYLVAPGVLAVEGGTRFLLLVDSSIRAIDATTGRTLGRWSLDQQALGWPAALAAAPDGRVFVAGQPANAWTAQVEALDLAQHGRARVLWRAPLGLTHAGIWLADAGQGLLAVYLPDAHDAAGMILLLDRATGAERRSYAVPAPPLAADSVADRLYVASGDLLRAFSLRRGTPVASKPGAAPIAVDSGRGLLAYAGGGGLMLAAAATLRPLRRVGVPEAEALTFAPDGGSLFVGAGSRISRIGLAYCAAH